MQKLSWVIENEINFGNAMNFFKMQISDAILYYKSNNENLNRKISFNCLVKTQTKGGLNKKKTFNSILKAFQSSSNKLFNLNVKLSDLFADINKNYIGLGNFWNSLTLKICKSISGNPEKCWNGAGLSK